MQWYLGWSLWEVFGVRLGRQSGTLMMELVSWLEEEERDFPGGPVVKTSPSNAGGASLIPGQGAKIPYASRPKNQNIKQKQYRNKFNKDF